jgi:pyridoxine 5-phosphate synthase
MTKLSVNINKVALIRNSRGKNLPNILKVSQDLLNWGAQGITVHPRPDGRHIRFQDVGELSQLVAADNKKQNRRSEFNVEGYPQEDLLRLIEAHRPHQATLVPDPPEALTSDAGWDFVGQEALLTRVSRRLKEAGVRVSLFLDPQSMDESQWLALSRIGCQRVELYTEYYALKALTPARDETLELYAEAARRAQALGLGVNAGHDLNLENLGALLGRVPAIEEVSIGHALVCEALYLGFKETLSRYMEILRASHAG